MIVGQFMERGNKSQKRRPGVETGRISFSFSLSILVALQLGWCYLGCQFWRDKSTWKHGGICAHGPRPWWRFKLRPQCPSPPTKKSDCVVSHFRLQIRFQTCCHHVSSHMFRFSFFAQSHPSRYRLVVRCVLVLAYFSSREGLGFHLGLEFLVFPPILFPIC